MFTTKKNGIIIQLRDLTIIEKQNLNNMLITNNGDQILELREYHNGTKGVFLPNGLFRFIKNTQSLTYTLNSSSNTDTQNSNEPSIGTTENTPMVTLSQAYHMLEKFYDNN